MDCHLKNGKELHSSSEDDERTILISPFFNPLLQKLNRQWIRVKLLITCLHGRADDQTQPRQSHKREYEPANQDEAEGARNKKINRPRDLEIEDFFSSTINKSAAGAFEEPQN